MKAKKAILLALSLGIGVTCALPVMAAVNGDQKVERSMRSYPGTKDGKTGTYVEQIDKTYRFVEDPTQLAVRDAIIAILGHEPTDAEWAQWYGALSKGKADDIKKSKDQIANLYLSVLGRAATPSEMLAAMQRMANGTKFDTIHDDVYALTLQGRIAAKFPGFPIPQNELALIAKLGDASLNSVATPPNVKESAYPPGFFNRDPGTWRSLFNGGWDWSPRINMVNAASGGASLNRGFDASALVSFVGWTSNGWWQDNNMTNLVKNLGGVYEVINQGSNPKIAITFKQSPGSSVTRGLLWGGNGNISYIVDQGYPGGLDNTVVYFMNEAQRYMDMSNKFSSVGAGVSASQARSRAESLMAMLAGVVSDPLVLDLNGNGKIDVTGKSTAKVRNPENSAFVKSGAVPFDLLKSGKPVLTEWLKDGDAFLVDDSKGLTSKAVIAGQPLTGVNLLGDVDGYTGGFYKLMAMNPHAKQASLQMKLSKDYGVMKGDALKNLKLWIDNGDGVAQTTELKSLSELGITEIGLLPQMVKANNGEMLERSYFLRNGKKQLMQEVWFAHE